MNKKQRLERDIQRITDKINELERKLESLQQEYQKLVDMEILEAVHSVQVTPEELRQVLSAIHKNPISPVLPEPDPMLLDTEMKGDKMP